MYEPSKQWKEDQFKGKLGEVKFDVTCDHCGKTLGENIGADKIKEVSFQVDKPLKVFCNYNCAKGSETKNHLIYWIYGWRPL